MKDDNYITMRCLREINHSKTHAMLEVAWKYYENFCNLLRHRRVKNKVLRSLDEIMTRAYHRRKRWLDVL